MANATATVTNADNNFIAAPNYTYTPSSHSGNVHSRIQLFADPLLWNDDFSSLALEPRVTLYRTQTVDFSSKGYTLLPGLQFALAGRDHEVQYRFNVGYTPGVFTAPNNTSFQDLHLFEVSGDVSLIKQFNNVFFEVGARAGVGIASFAFATPITINNQSVEGDGLSKIFIASPVGLQIDLGKLTLEYQLFPTLSFHDSESELGFDNDLIFEKWTLPMALGVGINF